MNILVVCHFGLYQDLSFSFVHNQIREYAALGHRVRVIIPNGVGKRGRNGGRFEKPLHISEVDGVELFDLRYVTLSRYGEKHFNSASAIAAIHLQWNHIFEDFQPDVIHAHTLGFDSQIGAWLKEKWECPLVVTTHGSDTFIPFADGRCKELKRYADAADVVVCVSSLLRRTLEECGATTKLDVILNGFNIKYSASDKPKDPAYIMQVGSLIPRKKTDITIRAIAMLKEKNTGIRFMTIGSGVERANLEKLCAELNVLDSVTFAGQLSNQEVHEKLSEATFFVMPSVREGFGIVYLEAMAAGCVVIGTEGEGIADVIVNGENGFLVPADNPERIASLIDRCLQHPEKAYRIAMEGRKSAIGLTWKRNAEEYTKLFKQLKEKSTH